jgi:hypothetical protein
MAHIESTRELIRSILKDDYVVPVVETYTITEDVGAAAPCRIAVTLRGADGAQGATIKGEGVGFIDALCAGLLAHYAREFESLKTVQFTGFNVRAKMDTTRVATGSDAVGIVALTVRNSEGSLFEFERQGRSLTATALAVVVEAFEHFVNSEKAFITVYRALTDAKERGRADLVSTYTTQLAQLVTTTSYTQVIERIRKEFSIGG